MTNKGCYIQLSDVSLSYELYHDKTNSLKEMLVNKLSRRSYVPQKKSIFVALDNISISLEQGERLGIIGHNGSGKSTILKVMSRLLVPTTGSLKIQGSVQPLIEIGAGFNPEFSGRQNIYFNGSMLGFTKKEIREVEREIIEFAELDDFIDTPLKYYSSGMAVRLAFTIATMIKPEILLLDEMLAAGDMEFMQKAQSRMKKILDYAKVLVCVSHDLRLIQNITERCIVMERGKVVFDGKSTDAVQYYQQKTLEKIATKSMRES